MITNNDVISQNLGDTIRRLQSIDVKPGSGTIEIHKWAMMIIATELMYCWNKIKQLENK